MIIYKERKRLIEPPNIPIFHDTCCLVFAYQDPSLLHPSSVRKPSTFQTVQ